MANPLMPKATAVWLVENTTLTFKQIADYCGLHELEVQAIADGEVAPGMHGIDPVASGQIVREEIARGQADPDAKLQMAKTDIPMPRARTRGARYTPVAKRLEKPDAIDWLLKTYPELADAQIGKLLGTTKATIAAVRDRTHWNAQNIRPQSPVEIGFCSLSELDSEIIRARRTRQRAEERRQRDERRQAREAQRLEAETVETAGTAAEPAASPADEHHEAPPAPEHGAELPVPEPHEALPAPERHAELPPPAPDEAAPETDEPKQG